MARLAVRRPPRKAPESDEDDLPALEKLLISDAAPVEPASRRTKTSTRSAPMLPNAGKVVKASLKSAKSEEDIDAGPPTKPKTSRRRVLKPGNDNPLLRPAVAEFEPDKKTRKVRTATSSLLLGVKHKEVAVETKKVEALALSNNYDEDMAPTRKQRSVPGMEDEKPRKNYTLQPGAGKGRSCKTGNTFEGDHDSSSEEEQIMRPTRSRAARPVTPPSVHVDEDEDDIPEVSAIGDDSADEDEDEDSDELSDFVVDDDESLSEASESEYESPKPAPRSVRRLVQGRRPGASPSKEPSAPPKLFGWSDDDDEESSPVPARRTEPQHKPSAKAKPSIPSIESSPLPDGTPILSYSPEPSPYKTKPRNKTPPASPEKEKQTEKKGLRSPSKKLFPSIPKTPHRLSSDDFWRPDVVNQWNDEYSPRKTLFPSPVKLTARGEDEDNDFENALTQDVGKSKGGKTPAQRKAEVSAAKAEKEAKKKFEESKERIATEFLKELDQTLTGGKVAEMAATTGGIKVIWSKTLNTTAGRANFKREGARGPARVVSSSQSAPIDLTASPVKPARPEAVYKYHAAIELAAKVITNEHSLLNTMAHEFCHLATFMISGMLTNPHGKEFKSWAAKASRAFKDRDIEVTTKHNYKIDFKYVWRCNGQWSNTGVLISEGCGTQFKRHSRSINPERQACGKCKGRLVQIKPAPRGTAAETGSGTSSASGPAIKEPKQMSEYQRFVKENMSRLRQENPGSPQKDIMGLLGKRYQEHKASKLQLSTTTVIQSGKTEIEGLMSKIEVLDLTSDLSGL
jgi:predicted SprT family Zn-dependent metalloprotease